VSGSPSDAPSGRPVLRVVSGSPTAEELAVLTALVAAAGSGGAVAAAEPPLRGRWNDPGRSHRALPAPGPGAWRASGLG
jgi:hypothetical protein